MEAVPTQVEVYERLAAGLDPCLSSLGMLRVARISWPCWMLKTGDGENLYLSLQVDEKATDTYAGGGFRVELEKSKLPRPASGLNGRAHFFQLLTSHELAAVLARQNEVIRALPKPPANQIDLYPDGRVRQEYLSWFEAQEGFDAIRTWLRYRRISDLDAWVRLLEAMIGAMVERAAEHLRTDTRHLGRGSLVEARP